MSQPLIIALSKGRLLKETLPILAEAGIELAKIWVAETDL